MPFEATFGAMAERVSFERTCTNPLLEPSAQTRSEEGGAGVLL